MSRAPVKSPPPFLVSCEHAGTEIPPDLKSLFRESKISLPRHRWFDFGAVMIAQRLASHITCPLLAGHFTRLVVDLNRSPENRSVFSEVTRPLPADERRRLLRAYHTPYRETGQWLLEQLIAAHSPAPVTHISVHTFTPVLHGKMRDVEIGFLFDPGRTAEQSLCRAWKSALLKHELLPENYRIRFNRPYQGRSDGYTTRLRTVFGESAYIGIEIEVNAGLFESSRKPSPAVTCRRIADLLFDTLPPRSTRDKG